MLLKSVDIQGFKTFPDKTKLKFEEDFVAVVGPNGSGKSNVSDAIRWVLGEQSARILRCSKMEDVIFKGTTGRKALGYAEVTMNIENTDRELNFDNDNVSITRRYYRSGESDYLINKNTVRLKDINELFMDTGLGRDGYSIIGQGKIDAIVSAKSDERREIFEEASGISRFRYRKEESERRLKKTEENLVRLRDIVSELEDRVAPLKIQSEKAYKFIELEKEKRSIEIGIWNNTLNSSAKVLREYSEKTETALSEYNSIEDELEKINNENIKTSFKTSEITAKMEEERNLATSLDEEDVRIHGNIGVIKNDTEHCLKNIERIENEIELTKNSDENLDSEIKEKSEEIELKNAKIDEQNKRYITLSDELENLRKNSEGISLEIDNLTIESAKINSIIAGKNVSVSSMTSSVSEIQNRGETLNSSVNEVFELKDNLFKNLAMLKDFFSELEEKNTKLLNSLSGYGLRFTSRKDKLDLLKTKIDEIKLEASENQRRAKILEDLERNLEGFAHSVKAVIKESEHGFLKGIHGPVTKILKVPSEYSVAIETCLGAAMQNIVTETEYDAKNAISFLKKKNIGRATFLPLSTIKGSVIETRDFEDMQGFVGIASNLVKCENRYNSIKNSILGRIIVAEDLDCATYIAKKISYRYRVVSLDGQTVNVGGSLTGGSQARNSGLLSRSSDIAKFKEKAENLYKTVEEQSEVYKKYSEEISSLNAEIELIKAEITTLDQDKVRTETEIKSTEREIENTENLYSSLLDERDNSQKRIDELKENISILENEIKELTMKLLKLGEESRSLGGDREETKSSCDKINEELQAIRLTSVSYQKDKEALEAAVKSLEERKFDAKGLIEKLTEQKEEYSENINSLNARIEQMTTLSAETKVKAQNIRENILNLSSQREELEKMTTTLRESERSFLEKRENTSKELTRLQERRDNLQKEYDVIITKLWEEYELTKREAEEQAIEIEDVKAAGTKLSELKNKIRALGTVNVAAIEEYKEVSERYEFLSEQVEDVEKSRNELLKLILELTHSMQQQFRLRFEEIAKNFTEIFKELFGGGTANLQFTDENDILNSGIEIKVHPPGKIVSHIESLSGGEKALVAIAIYFAIMKVNPPAFCMLDEVEAALDDVNVRRFAEYLKRMNEKTQFIVITHRRGTMENADMLYGVTMQEDGISKILQLKTHEAAEKLGIKQ